MCKEKYFFYDEGMEVVSAGLRKEGKVLFFFSPNVLVEYEMNLNRINSWS